MQGRKGRCHLWTSEGPQAHIRIPLGNGMLQPAVLHGEQAAQVQDDNNFMRWKPIILLFVSCTYIILTNLTNLQININIKGLYFLHGPW